MTTLLRVHGIVESLGMHKLAAVARVAGLTPQQVTFENLLPLTDPRELDSFARNCHPLTQVPILDLGPDGYIFSSNAIIRHLLRVASQLPPSSSSSSNNSLYNSTQLYNNTSLLESAQIDQWIEFSSCELDANIYPLYAHQAFGGLAEGEDQDDDEGVIPATLEQLKENLHKSFAGLESWLETRTFLVGERFTAADVVVGVALEQALGSLCGGGDDGDVVLEQQQDTKYNISAEFWKYRNVVRFYQTVFHVHPAGFGAAQLLCRRPGNGAVLTKPAAGGGGGGGEQQQSKKKQGNNNQQAAGGGASAGGGGAAQPAAPKKVVRRSDDADDHYEGEPEVPREEKKVNPLDLLPRPTMDLDAFKREYSNNRDFKAVRTWLKDNWDDSSYQLWFCRYKYGDELQRSFMTSNLVRGWFQRMEHNRKYAFGIALICGSESSHNIMGMWIIRKNPDGELPQCVLDVEDTTLFDWTKSSPMEESSQDLMLDYFEWLGTESGRTAIGTEVLEGRCFK